VDQTIVAASAVTPVAPTMEITGAVTSLLIVKGSKVEPSFRTPEEDKEPGATSNRRWW